MRVVSIDGLRGVFLLLMMQAHLQGIIASELGKANHHRISFADAAHGFVLLSGIVVGLYLTRVFVESGESDVWRFVRKRVRIIYAFHIGTALVLASLAALTPSPAGLLNQFEGAFGGDALFELVTLARQPRLLTILPMYLVLMAIAPICIRLFSNGRAHLVFGASASLWLLTQFSVPQAVGVWAAENLRYPYANFAGVFRVVAWQFIFVLGLYVGNLAVLRQPVLTRLTAAAAANVTFLAATFILLAALKLYFDYLKIVPNAGSALARNFMASQSKWTASPLHLVSLVVDAAVLLALTGGASALRPGLMQNLSRVVTWIVTRRPLVRLGSNSIEVFSAHILIVYAADHVLGPDGMAEAVRFLLLWTLVGTLFLVPVCAGALKSALRRFRALLLRPKRA